MYDVNFYAWHLEKINSGEPALYILSRYSMEPSFLCLLMEESGDGSVQINYGSGCGSRRSKTHTDPDPDPDHEHCLKV
jgi:hypothetical protein